MSAISKENGRQLRHRAAECRDLASLFREAAPRAKMLAIAEEYERLAETNDKVAALEETGPPET
jgi:hypothetical protein